MARPSATPALPAGSCRDCGTEAAGNCRIGSVGDRLGDGTARRGRGLRLTPAGACIELRSDSELLIDGMRFRVSRWQQFGWRNSCGFELLHQELCANSSNSVRGGRFVGAGFAATAAIRFSPALISLPIRPREPKLAACPWLPGPTIALLGTNLLENHDDRWQYAL